jgi:hypothetical protein
MGNESAEERRRYEATVARVKAAEGGHDEEEWTGYGPRRRDLRPLPWWRLDWRLRNRIFRHRMRR